LRVYTIDFSAQPRKSYDVFIQKILHYQNLYQGFFAPAVNGLLPVYGELILQQARIRQVLHAGRPEYLSLFQAVALTFVRGF